MRVRLLAALPALALVASLAGCGSDDGGGAQIRRVGSAYDTIQGAVDDAKPGDLILIAPGTYHEAVTVTTDRLVIRGQDRNDVILDGEDELTNGFEVESDQVAIENLTVQRYAINGVLFTGGYGDDPQAGPVGWRASYVTAANNGLYGIYAFGTGPGQVDNSYASGHPDSGIYVGQCQDCGAVVRDNVLERNAIGYENTNASGVIVVGNVIRHNRVGMTVGSGTQELLAPQVGGRIEANLVVDNDEAEAPVTEGGFGFGIVIAGGQGNEVQRNVVSGHPGAGIVVVDQDGYAPVGNSVSSNELARNAVDLALVTESGEGGPSDANCFGSNEPASSLPPDLELLVPCDGADAEVPAATLTFPDPPPPWDYRDTPLPPDQPDQPGNPEQWEPPTREAPEVDPGGMSVPEG